MSFSLANSLYKIACKDGNKQECTTTETFFYLVIFEKLK